MKKRRLTRFVAAFVLALMSLGAFAQVQVPDSFNYQAIVRDVNGNVLAGEEVTVRMTFLDGITLISTADYIVETNNYGLINLAADLMPATFAGTYYAEPKIKIEVDFGSGFVELGINDLQSVPYAMQAGNVATLNGNVITVGTGSSVTIPDAALVGQNAADIETLQGDVVTIQSSITLLGNTVADHTTRIEALEDAGFITNAEETDPVFQAAPAYGITASDVQHWGMAYGWEDHSTFGYATELWVEGQNYLTTESDLIFKASPAFGITASDVQHWQTAYGWEDHSTFGYATELWVEGQNYLTTESDLIFKASPAFGITASDVQHWQTAYGWEDHSTFGYATELWVEGQNYLTTESDLIFKASPAYGITATDISEWDDAFSWGNHHDMNYLTSYTETDPIFMGSIAYTITQDDRDDWDEAFSWGDHSEEGYLVGPEMDPIFTGSIAYTITLEDRDNWDEAHGWGNHQPELDNTQLGAGLQTDGSYLPPAAAKAANYISGATSLFNADELLDAQIKINENDIATNSGLIAGNTSQIATNATNIATNAANIESNFNLIDENSHWIFDDDQDTYITVEETPDEDVIHMYANGDEMLRIKKKGQLEVLGESLFIGDEAGDNAITNTDNNIFIGPKAGKNTTTGANNVFIGYTSGISNISGSNNLYLGNATGYFSTVGSSNTLLGAGSGKFVSSGADNTYVGASSGMHTTTGAQNAFVGVNTGYSNTVGSLNVALGANASYNNVNGSHNTVVGALANYQSESGVNNTILGSFAGYNNLNGAGNVFIGHRAGYYETGSDKLYISNHSGTDELNGQQTSMLYGDFAAEFLHINVQTTVTVPEQAFEDVNHTVGSGALVVNGGTYIYRDLYVNEHTHLDQTTIDVNDGEFLIHDGQYYSPTSTNGMMADVNGYIGLVSQLDGNAASGIQTIDESNRPTAALSLNAVNGGIDIQAASDVAIDAQNIYGDATQSISLDAAETSNFTVTNNDAAQNLLINVAGTGQAHQLNLVSTGTENWQNSDAYGAAIRMLASDGGIDIDAFEGVDIYAQTTSQFRVVNNSDPQNLNIGVEGGTSLGHILNLFSEGNGTPTVGNSQDGAIQMTAVNGGIDVYAGDDVTIDGTTVYINGTPAAKGSSDQMAVGIGTDGTNGNIHIGHDTGDRNINIGLYESTGADTKEINLGAADYTSHTSNITSILADNDIVMTASDVVDVEAGNNIFLTSAGSVDATSGINDAAAIQINAPTGGLDIEVGATVAINAVDIIGTASQGISWNATTNSNFTVGTGNLTLDANTENVFVEAKLNIEETASADIILDAGDDVDISAGDYILLDADGTTDAEPGLNDPTPAAAIQLRSNGGIDLEAADDVAIDANTVYINGLNVAKGDHPAVSIGSNDNPGNILIGYDQGKRNINIGQYESTGAYTDAITIGGKKLTTHTSSNTKIETEANMILDAAVDVDMDAGHDVLINAVSDVNIAAFNINGDATGSINFDADAASHFVTSVDDLRIDAASDVVIGNLDADAIHIAQDGVTTFVHGHLDVDGNTTLDATHITLGDTEQFIVDSEAGTTDGGISMIVDGSVTSTAGTTNTINGASVDVNATSGNVTIDGTAVFINGTASKGNTTGIGIGNNNNNGNILIGTAGARNITIGNANADAIGIDGFTLDIHTDSDATIASDGTMSLTAVNNLTMGSISGGFALSGAQSSTITSGVNLLVDAQTNLNLGTSNADLVQIAHANVQTTVLGNLHVVQPLTTASSLTVDGATNLNSLLDVDGLVTFNNTTTASATGTTKGALEVAGGVYIGDNLEVVNNIHAAGTITSGNSIIIDGTSTAGDYGIISETHSDIRFAWADLSEIANIEVETLSATTITASDGMFSGNLNVDGQTTLDATTINLDTDEQFIVSGTTDGGIDFDVADPIDIESDSDVEIIGTTVYINGIASKGTSTAVAIGTTSGSGNIEIGTAGDRVIAIGSSAADVLGMDAEVVEMDAETSMKFVSNGTMTMSSAEAMAFNSAKGFTMYGAETSSIKSGMQLTIDAATTLNLGTSSATTLNIGRTGIATNVLGSLHLAEALTLSDALTMDGVLTVTNATAADYSTQTGALVVDGGVYVEKNIETNSSIHARGTITSGNSITIDGTGAVGVITESHGELEFAGANLSNIGTLTVNNPAVLDKGAGDPFTVNHGGSERFHVDSDGNAEASNGFTILGSNTTYMRSGEISNGTITMSAGNITGIVGITASGTIQGGTLTDGTATLTGGVLTANGSTITGNSTINGDFFVNATLTESGVIQMKNGTHHWRFRIASDGDLVLEYSNDGTIWSTSPAVEFVRPAMP